MPFEIHTPEYDEAGRWLRTLITRESEWDDHERALMLALTAREAAECQRCGGDLTDTADPDNDAYNPFAAKRYKALPPVVCHRCVVLHDAEKPFAEHPQRHGMIHRTELVPRG